MGGLSVVVNGYEAKNDNDLADTIVHRINEMLNRMTRCGASNPAPVFSKSLKKSLTAITCLYRLYGV